MIRATVDDPEMARGVGIDVHRISIAVFRAGRRPGRGGRRGGRRVRRHLPGRRLRDPALRLRGRNRPRSGQPQGAVFRSLMVGLLDNFGKALFPELSYFTLFAPMAAHPRDPTHRAVRGGLKPRLPWGARARARGARPRALVVPPLLSSFLLSLVTQALIYAILAMSLDIILGYIGLASLGHAAYFGLGAYAVGILSTATAPGSGRLWPRECSSPPPAAAIFGLVALRATGVYFLMITLALGMVVWGLANRWVSMTQGDNGISSVPRPDRAALVVRRRPRLLLPGPGRVSGGRDSGLMVHSPFGKTLVGIRESASRMRTLGYDVWLHKYVAFVIAGTVGGFSGVFWAYYNGFVSPADMELTTSVKVLLMVALGGRGTLLGPALGALIIVPAGEPGLGLHPPLAPDPGRRLHRHHRVRAGGVRGAVRRWRGKERRHGQEADPRTPRVPGRLAALVASPSTPGAQKGPSRSGSWPR